MLRKPSDSLMMTEDDFSEIEVGADGMRLYKTKSVRSKTNPTDIGLGSRSISNCGSNSMIGGPHSVYGGPHSVYGGSRSMYGRSRPVGVSRSVCGGFNRNAFDYQRDFDNMSGVRYRDASPVSVRSLRSIDPSNTETLQMYLQETLETVVYPLQDMIKKAQLRQPNLPKRRFIRETRRGSEETTDYSSEDRYSARSEFRIRYKKRSHHKAHPYARREEQFYRGERSRSNSVLSRSHAAKPLKEPDLRNLICTAATDDADNREKIRAEKENVANDVRPRCSKNDHEFLKPNTLSIPKKSSIESLDFAKSNKVQNIVNTTSGKIVNQSKRLSDVSEVPETAENACDDSMRPSFIKRKLFTLSQDVVLEKEFNDSRSESPVHNFYSSGPRQKNKVDKLVGDQPLVERNIFENTGLDMNMRNLINQLVPQEKLNITVENIQKTQERSSTQNSNIRNTITKVNPPQESALQKSAQKKKLEIAKNNTDLHNLKASKKSQSNAINIQDQLNVKTAEKNQINKPNQQKQLVEASGEAQNNKLTQVKHNVKISEKNDTSKPYQERQKVKTSEKVQTNTHEKPNVKTIVKINTSTPNHEKQHVKVSEEARNNKLTQEKPKTNITDKNKINKPNEEYQKVRTTQKTLNNTLNQEKPKPIDKIKTSNPNNGKQHLGASEKVRNNKPTQGKQSVNATDKNTIKHNHEKQIVKTSEKALNNKLTKDKHNVANKQNVKTTAEVTKATKLNKPNDLNQRTRSLDKFSTAQKKWDTSESDNEISFRTENERKQEDTVTNGNSSGQSALRRSTRKIVRTSRFSEYLFDNTPTGNKSKDTSNSSTRRKRELSFDELNVPERRSKKQRSVSPTYTASDLGSPRPALMKCVEKCKDAERIVPRRSPRNMNNKASDKNEFKEIVSAKKVTKQKLSFGSKTDTSQHKPTAGSKKPQGRRTLYDSFLEDSSADDDFAREPRSRSLRSQDATSTEQSKEASAMRSGSQTARGGRRSRSPLRREVAPERGQARRQSLRSASRDHSFDSCTLKVTNESIRAPAGKESVGQLSRLNTTKPSTAALNDKNVFKQPFAVGKVTHPASVTAGEKKAQSALYDSFLEDSSADDDFAREPRSQSLKSSRDATSTEQSKEASAMRSGSQTARGGRRSRSPLRREVAPERGQARRQSLRSAGRDHSFDSCTPTVTNESIRAPAGKENVGQLSRLNATKPSTAALNDKNVFKQPFAVGKASLKRSFKVGRARNDSLSNLSQSSVRKNTKNRSALPAKILKLLGSDWEDETDGSPRSYDVRSHVDTLRHMPSSTKNQRQSPARSVISMRSEMVRPSQSLVNRAAHTFNTTRRREDLYSSQIHCYEPGMTSLTVGVKPCFYRAMNSTRNDSKFDDNASVASAHSFKSFRSMGRLNYSTLHFK